MHQIKRQNMNLTLNSQKTTHISPSRASYGVSIVSILEKIGHAIMEPGGWINIQMPSYQYRKSHCGNKTILRPSYLHNGISYTGKMTSLYWIRAQTLLLSGHSSLLLHEFITYLKQVDMVYNKSQWCGWYGDSAILLWAEISEGGISIIRMTSYVHVRWYFIWIT